MRTLPQLRSDLRGGLRESPRRGLRQGRHRSPAGSRPVLPGPVHTDPDGIPRPDRDFLPGRSAAGHRARRPDRPGQGARHGRGAPQDRRRQGRPGQGGRQPAHRLIGRWLGAGPDAILAGARASTCEGSDGFLVPSGEPACHARPGRRSVQPRAPRALGIGACLRAGPAQGRASGSGLAVLAGGLLRLLGPYLPRLTGFSRVALARPGSGGGGSVAGWRSAGTGFPGRCRRGLGPDARLRVPAVLGVAGHTGSAPGDPRRAGPCFRWRPGQVVDAPLRHADRFHLRRPWHRGLLLKDRWRHRLACHGRYDADRAGRRVADVHMGHGPGLVIDLHARPGGGRRPGCNSLIRHPLDRSAFVHITHAPSSVRSRRVHRLHGTGRSADRSAHTEPMTQRRTDRGNEWANQCGFASGAVKPVVRPVFSGEYHALDHLPLRSQFVRYKGPRRPNGPGGAVVAGGRHGHGKRCAHCRCTDAQERRVPEYRDRRNVGQGPDARLGGQRVHHGPGHAGQSLG